MSKTKRSHLMSSIFSTCGRLSLQYLPRNVYTVYATGEFHIKKGSDGLVVRPTEDKRWT